LAKPSVGHLVAARLRCVTARLVDLAQLDTARAKIVEDTTDDAVVLAAAAQL